MKSAARTSFPERYGDPIFRTATRDRQPEVSEVATQSSEEKKQKTFVSLQL
jgi:hypothetical protein